MHFRLLACRKVEFSAGMVGSLWRVASQLHVNKQCKHLLTLYVIWSTGNSPRSHGDHTELRLGFSRSTSYLSPYFAARYLVHGVHWPLQFIPASIREQSAQAQSPYRPLQDDQAHLQNSTCTLKYPSARLCYSHTYKPVIVTGKPCRLDLLPITEDTLYNAPSRSFHPLV